MELNGKTAIITGTSGELGHAIALSLAGRGMNCVCHYHTSQTIAVEVVAQIRANGQRAIAVGADLSEAGAAKAIFKAAADFGDVCVLINSASIFQRQPLGTFDEAEVSKLMAVNVTAPMMLCSEFAEYLQGTGVDLKKQETTIASIVNMVDVAGLKPWGGYGPYSASRAAMIGMTKSLAKALAPAVTVNAIAPGIVTWPGKMDPSEEHKQLSMIPAGRFGEPKDITQTIDFLLDNTYITGQVLCVDGGRSL